MKTIILRPTGSTIEEPWLVIGAANAWQALDDEVETPTVPNLTDYCKSTSVDGRLILTFPQIADLQSLINITVQSYQRKVGAYGGEISCALHFPDDQINFGNKALANGYQWQNWNEGGIGLTKEQTDNMYIELVCTNNENQDIRTACVYLVIEYEEVPPAPTNADALPKRIKPMSGYNYFLKSYIERKNKGLDPLKLPDGTLF